MSRRLVHPLPVLEQTIYWIVGVAGILYGVQNVYVTGRGRMSRRLVHPLPVLEQTIYWIVGVAGILYAVLNVYVTGRDQKRRLHYVVDGAQSLGASQDMADFEWHVYSTYLFWRLLPLLLLHAILSRVLQLLRLQGQARKLTYIALGVAAACHLQSWRFLLLLVVTPLPFYLASTLHSLPAVWLVSAAFVYICNSQMNYVVWLLRISNGTDNFVVIYIWASAILRCMYFGIERVWCLKQLAFSSGFANRGNPSDEKLPANNQKKKSSAQTISDQNTYGKSIHKQKHLYSWPVLSEVPDLLDVFLYVFYLPFLSSGPPLTYMCFSQQFQNPAPLSRDRLQSILLKILRVCFWFFFNNVMLHFLFFEALGQTPELLQVIDKWTLTTVVYLIGQFMTNKYVVIFGAMTQLAALDGLLLPDNPACISYIYAYSDLWKSFDRGLYSCLKRYIYIPLGGSQSGFVPSKVATLATFLFMGYWHGGGKRYLMWSLLSFVEVILEQAGASLEKSFVVQRHLMSRLSPAGQRRLRCAMAYPLFLMATASNMIFLVGLELGKIYTFRICLEWNSFLAFGVVTYSLTQVSKHLESLGCTKFA